MRDWSGCNSEAVEVAQREPKWDPLPLLEEETAPSAEAEPPVLAALAGRLPFHPS